MTFYDILWLVYVYIHWASLSILFRFAHFLYVLYGSHCSCCAWCFHPGCYNNSSSTKLNAWQHTLIQPQCNYKIWNVKYVQKSAVSECFRTWSNEHQWTHIYFEWLPWYTNLIWLVFAIYPSIYVLWYFYCIAYLAFYIHILWHFSDIVIQIYSKGLFGMYFCASWWCSIRHLVSSILASNLEKLLPCPCNRRHCKKIVCCCGFPGVRLCLGVWSCSICQSWEHRVRKGGRNQPQLLQNLA